MKKFLSKRWHGIPMALLSLLCCLSVVGAAAYYFITARVEVTIKEPISIQYSTDAQHWTTLEDGVSFNVGGFPGDRFIRYLLVTNNSQNDYAISMVVTESSGILQIDSDFPDSISGGDQEMCKIVIEVPSNAPAGEYLIIFQFGRN